MSASNGNGRHRAPIVRCERASCRTSGTKLAKLGLCTEHFAELLEVGPDDFPWKKQASERARNHLGHYISRLDEESIGKAIAMIKATGLRDEAFAFAGIPRSTWKRWLQLGRAEDPPPLCAELVTQIEDALASWELSVVGSIMTGDPRVKLDLLKHHPETKSRYAPVSRTEIANADGVPFRTTHTLDLSNLSLEEKRAMARLLEKAGEQPDVIDAEIIELPQRAGGGE